MPVLPIVFIFIAFWPSDINEVVKLTQIQVIEHNIKVDYFEKWYFIDEESECNYCAVVVDEQTMDYVKYCVDQKRDNEKSM